MIQCARTTCFVKSLGYTQDALVTMLATKSNKAVGQLTAKTSYPVRGNTSGKIR